MLSIYESLIGIYQGVRDGKLGDIYSNTKDTIKTVGRGTFNTAKAIGNGSIAAGQHIARNNKAYMFGGGLAAGIGGLGYFGSKLFNSSENNVSNT